MLLALGWLAIASSCSTADAPKPVVRTVIAKPVLPAIARAACAAPVDLPDRDLTGKEVTSYWGRDRSALSECEVRRAAAVAALE